MGSTLRWLTNEEKRSKGNEKEVGEIIVKGDTVTKGYWKLPEETAKAIKDGWLFTGDMAVIDEEGYVTIVDRKKDMILTGGENVYSTEVENVLYMHPAILECAVVGVPDEKWGEVVKGIVVLRPGQRCDRGRDHPVLQGSDGSLQGSEIDRFHRCPSKNRLRKDTQKESERQVLGGLRQESPLSGGTGLVSMLSERSSMKETYRTPKFPYSTSS